MQYIIINCLFIASKSNAFKILIMFELEVNSEEECREEVDIRVLDVLGRQPLRQADRVGEGLLGVGLHLGGSPLTEHRAGTLSRLSGLSRPSVYF